MNTKVGLTMLEEMVECKTITTPADYAYGYNTSGSQPVNTGSNPVGAT